MLDNTSVCDSAAHLLELEKAFGVFTRVSNELQSSYQALEQRVARLTAELEDARRASQSAAAEAERTAQRLRSLLATLPGGVVVVDDSGEIQEHNRIAADILGGDLVGESWQRVVKDVLRNPPSADGDWLTRDGRRIALAASSLPQESVKIILLTDVTDTRALQELAARNQRLSAIGKMAASLAHQIR
ncbi:MAG TPA: PAS domain-containing protein, partial [Gammaproteobacteria bacterium]|nr:PAS domain-containing protein [Gammaproteobacteria bacterium]